MPASGEGGIVVTLALWLVAAAGALHVLEEYVWPGGFLDAMRRVAPGYAFAVNRSMAVIINGLMFLVLCTAPFAADGAPLFALSAAGLVAVNGWSHIAGSIRLRGHIPGVVIGLFVYQPAAAFAYFQFARAHRLTSPVLMGSVLLGAAYHLVPLGYFATRRLGVRIQTLALDSNRPSRKVVLVRAQSTGRPASR
jgi:hypothetical protein